MPRGRPRTDSERRERHKSIFGESSEPPKERRGTQFGVMSPTGEVAVTHTIDLSKVKSDDPIAYAYGMVQGERGEPLEKDEDLAKEYIRGWEEGHRKFKEKKLKEVV